MKGYAYCTKCKKIVEIAELYISNTVLNVYLKCGHHYHIHIEGKIIEE